MEIEIEGQLGWAGLELWVGTRALLFLDFSEDRLGFPQTREFLSWNPSAALYTKYYQC